MVNQYFEPTINGRRLSEFCAKMQSYPVISSCTVETEIFQGSRRSSIQLLSNRRGERYLECVIDFFGNNADRTRNMSEFEAQLTGSEPILIDINDGYFYRAICTKVGNPSTVREVVTSVQYRFRVTRHRNTVTGLALTNDQMIYCDSNVERTDCTLTIKYDRMLGASDVDITLNGLSWSFSETVTGDLVLDGIHKVFTMGGDNISGKSAFTWFDFPYLIPGRNVIGLSIQGVVPYGQVAEISYTPTFL